MRKFPRNGTNSIGQSSLVTVLTARSKFPSNSLKCLARQAAVTQANTLPAPSAWWLLTCPVRTQQDCGMPPPVTPVRFHVCLGKTLSCRNTYSGLLSYPSIRPRQTLNPTISLFEGLAANHSQARTQSSMNDTDLLSSCVPCILTTSTRIQRVPLALPFPFAL